MASNSLPQRYPPRLIEAALALHDNRLGEAEPFLTAHLKADPFDVAAMRMLPELAGRIGCYRDAEALLRRAIALYERVLAEAPHPSRAWMSYGHVLETVGRQADGIAAYRRALGVQPSLGRLPATSSAPRHSLAGFSVGAEFRRFSIEVFLQNAFDKRGQLSHFEECGPCGQRAYTVPITPHMIGVRLHTDF